MALLDAGTYRARAVEGALGETKTGKEQVVVRFQLIGEGLAVTHLSWFGYFTEKTTESTFRALRTAGWRGQDLADLSDLSRSDAPEVDLVVEHEAGQDGVVRARIRWVNSAGGVGLGTQLAPDKAKAFAARMRGKLAAYDQAAGVPAPRKAAKKAPSAFESVPPEVLDQQEHEADSDGMPF